MGHQFRDQFRLGALVVRLSGASISGFALMSTAFSDEPDRFATMGTPRRIALTGSAASLTRLETAGALLNERMRAVLGLPHLLVAKRRFSFVATGRMLDAPVSMWQWEDRGVLLSRLEMVWSVSESLEDPHLLELLRRAHPLGKLADLSFESFSGDEEFRAALSEIDLPQARGDYAEISRQLEHRMALV